MTGISQVDIIKNSVISGKIDSSYCRNYIHKNDPKLVHKAVEFALKMRNDGSCQE